MALLDIDKHQEPEALFIDVRTKTYFYDTDLIEPEYHLENAFWIPALGTRKFDGHIYISGGTGAGKSFMIKKMIENDAKKRECILFTELQKDDETFDGLTFIKYIVKDPTNPKKVFKPLEDEELRQKEENKILIFDDVQFSKDVLKYRDWMLQKARHCNSTVICVNHKLQDYKKSEVPLVDARYVIGFPTCNRGALAKFLRNFMEMKNKKIDEILETACLENIKRSQLIIHKYSPNAVASRESIWRI